MSFDPYEIRNQFPALQRKVNGKTVVYADGPGGTQVSQRVIDAMAGYLRNGLSNAGGAYATSKETDDVARSAHEAVADLLNARRPEEIAFGQNMTSLTYAVSRAISREWHAGDEIVVTKLDHDGNISPWLQAAEDRDVILRWLDFHPQDCTLALEELPALINDRTRLVAVTYASNAIGSITDMTKVSEIVHRSDAILYVDAVHYMPHGVVDVQAVDCDFLACSAYKFFGPHTGILYGKYEHLMRLPAYQVRPASKEPPTKWETGTQSFESLAGVTAAVEYIAALGMPAESGSLRERLVHALQATTAYEQTLSQRFLAGAAKVPGLCILGITDKDQLTKRAPTFSMELEGYSSRELATFLGEQGIFVADGNYYALAAMERLGFEARGGLVRAGFVHYNTVEEIDRLLGALDQLARTK